MGIFNELLSRRLIRGIKDVRTRYMFFIVMLITSVIGQSVLWPINTFAGPAFSGHPIAPTYTSASDITTANGHLWYTQKDASGLPSIGKMSPGGVNITNYSIMPSGTSYMKIGSITTGPDGNVWFTGCSSTSGTGSSWTMLAGSIDASTGAIAYYQNTSLGLVPCSGTEGTPGRIIAGPDGAMWYSIRIHTTNPTIHKTTYLFRINISTGITTQALATSSGHLEINGLAAGPDGRIWASNGAAGYYNEVIAYTPNGSSAIAASTSYSTTGSHAGNIVSGPDGNLWIASASGLYKMTTGGVATHYWFSDYTSTYTNVYRIAVGPDNALWIAGQASGVSGAKIIRFTTDGNSTSYTSTLTGPSYSITSGPDGAMWFNGGGSNLGRLPIGPYFSAHGIAPTYTSASDITTARGYLWYLQKDSSDLPNIGRMSSNGANIANYPIMPSGASYMKITSITTGPDDNVWFAGCSSASGSGNSWTMLAGSIDTSTGMITYYQNTVLGLVPCNGTEGASGRIIAGPDGAMWYSVRIHTTNPTIHKTTYLFRVDISTGITTKPLATSSGHLSINGLTTGPDGRIWITNGAAGYYNQVLAYTVSSGGALTSGASYSTTGSHSGNIVSGPDGNLWIAGVYSGLYKMTTSGIATYHAFSDSTSVVTSVYRLAAGLDGALWIAGQASGVSGAKIIRFTTDGNSTSYTSTLAGNSNFITSGPDGAMWFSGSGSKLGRIGY